MDKLDPRDPEAGSSHPHTLAKPGDLRYSAKHGYIEMNEEGQWVSLESAREERTRLIAQVHLLREIVKRCLITLDHADLSYGCCMCGADMKNHGYDAGHNPLDAGLYHSEILTYEANLALTATKDT